MVNDLAQFSVFLLVLTAVAVPLGLYMARVFRGEWTWLSPLMAPLERGLYWVAGIRPDPDQHWSRYAMSLIAFNAAGFLLLYAILRLQHLLPLNPQDFGPMAPDLAFNTAISFVTNTNWQAYGGETTLSHLSQMMGLTTQNFISAATGIAVAVAVTRAVATRSGRTIGNFWVDVVRANLYVLLPVCLLYALFLVSQGMPQTLSASVDATTLEGGQQTIALGPVASQVAIKMLGTNGGGFFNANAAHPFENPTVLSNVVQILSILAIPAALPFFFGRLVGDMRQGVAIWAAMTVLFVVVLRAAWGAERFGNPLLADVVDPAHSAWKARRCASASPSRCCSWWPPR